LGCGKHSTGENQEASEPNSPHFEKPNIQSAAGLINGKEWHFVSGKALIEKHEAQDFLVVYLWNKDVTDVCAENEGSALQIHLKTLPKVGTYQVSKDIFRIEPLILFTDLEKPINKLDNTVAQEGYIAIDQMGSQLTGHFNGGFDHPDLPKSQAFGSFTVQLCDEN
jgi:hypothetical protein